MTGQRESKNRCFSLPLLALAVFVLAVAGFLLALLFPFRDNSLAQVKDRGIRVGYAVEAPYAFLSPAGEPTGESPEVVREVARRLAVEPILWRQVEFNALVDELEAGRIDVIAAGLFITPERQRRVRFSLPTFEVRPGLLVPKGNPGRLRSYADLARAEGAVVAVLSGSVEAGILQKSGVPEARLKQVPDAMTGLAAVETGVADALALSSPSLHWLAMEGKLQRTEPLLMSVPAGSEASQFGAFAFRKGDRRLLQAWNAALTAYIGSSEHLALVARFGFRAEEIPATASTTKESRP